MIAYQRKHYTPEAYGYFMQGMEVSMLFFGLTVMLRLLQRQVTTVFDYLSDGYQQAIAYYYEGGPYSIIGGRSWSLPSLHWRFVKLRAKSFLKETIVLHSIMGKAIDKFCSDIDFACMSKHNVPEFVSYRFDMREIRSSAPDSDEYRFSSDRMLGGFRQYVTRLINFDLNVATLHVLARVGGVLHGHTHGFLLRSQLMYRYVQAILCKFLLKALYKTAMGTSLTGVDSFIRTHADLRAKTIEGYTKYQTLYHELTGYPFEFMGRTMWVNGCGRWRLYKPDGRIYKPFRTWDICKERAYHTLDECTTLCALYSYDPPSLSSQDTESDYEPTPLYIDDQQCLPLMGPKCDLCNEESVPVLCGQCSDRLCVPCMAIHLRQCNSSYPFLAPEEEKKSFKRPRDFNDFERCDKCSVLSNVFYCRVCMLSMCIKCDASHLESRFACSGHHVSSVMEYLLGIRR